jgi:hypothetical protein
MRAPAALEPHDPLYESIKESFAERGVDVNAEMVDELYGPREWWGWEDYTPAQRPLRNVCKKWLIRPRWRAG